MRPPRSAFPAYLAGLGSWFIPLGVQGVLFPWLVAVVLHMDAFAVGIAQVALMAPSLLFLPLGGLVADRGNPRRLLIRYHLAYAVPPFVLALIVWLGHASYPVLIVYGLAAGSIGAFAIPTRDGLLPSIVKGNLSRAVALTTAMQMIGQLVGIAIASTADRFGAVPLLAMNGCLVLVGAIAVARLPDPPPHPPVEHPSYWHSIVEGIAEAARSQAMWPVLLLNAGIGVFYVGPFLAVIPLVIRDIYAGSAAELAYVNLGFWAGSIAAAMALAAIAKGVTLRGRLVVLAVSVGAVILAAMALYPPFLALTGLCFIWGLGAGITLTQSRTVVQIEAPPTHRARLMSLFQLGIGGGGPIGAFLSGTIASVWGLKAALVAPAAAMVLLIGIVLAGSRIWTMRTVEKTV